MSISSALSNAMTGLRAAGRTSEIISANIANASTPSYGVRSLGLSSSQIGGVVINGVDRNVDAGLLSELRLAEAAFANISDTSKFLTDLENTLGTPDEPNSIAARMSEFENSLIMAISRPDAPERLSIAIDSARDLATLISTTSNEIQEARSNADRSIQIQVDRLNTSLAGVKELNAQITKTVSRGGDASALFDNRQAIVDEISAIVPIRQVSRDRGQIALYSTGGAILLDGGVAEINFDAVNQVTPFMTVENGMLSGLTINGYPVRTDSQRGALSGGSLGAQFQIRDELGTKAQSQIDALARNIIERFQNSAVDGTLNPGDPGLFTDGGGAFDPINETGLSARLTINPLVDERKGGDPWRLRDGINAASPGDVGDSRLLQNLSAALNDASIPASGAFGAGAFSAMDLVSTLTSQVAADRYKTDQVMAFSSSRFDELTQQMLSQGVDTDQELQRLLIVEQSYAANVRLIKAADEMMQTILRL